MPRLYIGKWHLGKDPQSLPTAHGFDEFYGIPPDESWDSATYVTTIELTHSINLPREELLAKGPQIVEAVAGGPLKTVEPYTEEVRAVIDTTLVAKGIEFMKRQKAAGKAVFLVFAALARPSADLPGACIQRQIAHRPVRRQADGRRLPRRPDHGRPEGTRRSTRTRFWCSPQTTGRPVKAVREFGNQGTPDNGNAGPFRGELGDVTEGSIRTACLIRWPGKVKPGTSSYAMFSIMDFFPTFAKIVGGKVPTDRAIDGVDQTDVLLGKSETGNRDSLLSFVGPDLLAARWKQWRVYFTDMHPTGTGTQRLDGMFSSSAQHGRLPEGLQHRDGPA